MGRLHLFLIRHGESVDNVAGLYAGSRDSPLTSHGVLQTRRLGTHLTNRASSIGKIKHIFSSNLQRAISTAEAIRDAQNLPTAATSKDQAAVEVTRLPELREKDFGSGEGKKFGMRSDAPESSLADSESHDAMRIRVARFLNDHLAPIIHKEATGEGTHSVVIVAHGIILNVLLQALLSRFRARNISGIPSTGEPTQISTYLAPWSNTGYLEGIVTLPGLSSNSPPAPRSAKISSDNSSQLSRVSPTVEPGLTESYPWSAVRFSVINVNCVDHLQGLKKTRGGIGSAKFDEKQKTLTSFFAPVSKKRKAEDDIDDR